MEQATQVAVILQAIAQQLGIPVQYLWPHLVDYSYAASLTSLVTDAIFAITWFAASVVGVVLAVRGHRRQWTTDGYSTMTGGFYMAIFGWASAIICALFGVSFIGSAMSHIPGIMVPEAQVVYDLLAKINKK